MTTQHGVQGIYFLIYGTFNDCTASNVELFIDDKLEGIWKDVVQALL